MTDKSERINELEEALEYIRDRLPDCMCACTTDRDGAPVQCALCAIRDLIDALAPVAV